jgi:hypothetical protein
LCEVRTTFRPTTQVIDNGFAQLELAMDDDVTEASDFVASTDALAA